MSAEVNGVIHDIGYQRYTGPRLGRGYGVRSLYGQSLRGAFGLGRGAKAKVFPWIVVGLLTVIAVVLVAVLTQSPVINMPYLEFPQEIGVLMVLFCAVVAPELVSRDLRSGVLSLYFSRPITRADYPLAKLAAMVSGLFLIVALPLFIMFLGVAFSVDTLGAVWTELGRFGKGLAGAAMYATLYGALSLLIASLAGRRAVAAALVVAGFLVTTPVYGVLSNLGDASLQQLAGLASPLTLIAGVVGWVFSSDTDIGGYGPVYALTALGVVAVCVGLLLLRYRKVAR
jgi:ABC-2 type transport system permease protein